MSNLVATHAQKASEAEQGNHIIFFSPSLKPCPSMNIFYTYNFTSKLLISFVFRTQCHQNKTFEKFTSKDNMFVDRPGLRPPLPSQQGRSSSLCRNPLYYPSAATQSELSKGYQRLLILNKFSLTRNMIFLAQPHFQISQIVLYGPIGYLFGS